MVACVAVRWPRYEHSTLAVFFGFSRRPISSKVSEIGERHQVNLSYSDPERHRYASVSGLGLTLRDVEKMAELWDPIVKAWFPHGLDDPNLVLLRVSVDKAEYWDAAATPGQRLLAFTKAFKSGDPSEIGEHKKLRLNPGQN
jgi:general stress protein 26